MIVISYKDQFLQFDSHFYEAITAYVRRKICLYVGILNALFLGNLFRSWIMLCKTPSVPLKSISTERPIYISRFSLLIESVSDGQMNQMKG